MLHASTIDRPLAIIVQAIAHYLSLLKHLALAFSPSVWPRGLRNEVRAPGGGCWMDASGFRFRHRRSSLANCRRHTTS